MNAWRVAGVLCLIAIEALIYGYSYPFYSLALAQHGLASWLVGLNTSLAVAGLLFVGLITPDLVARFGVHPVVAGLFAVSFLSFAAILFADDLVIWFVARFVLGTCLAALWTMTEALLSNIGSDRLRHHLAGSSTSLFAASAFAGPLLLGVIGVGGWPPLVVAMVLLAAGGIVAVSVQSTQLPQDDDDPPPLEERNFGLAVSIAGGLVGAAFLCGVGKSSMLGLLPLYGLAHGFDDAMAASLVAMFFLGEAVFVIGAGWLAKRLGSRPMLLVCAVMSGVSALVVPLVGQELELLWAALFVAGGTITSTYGLMLVYLRQTLRSYRLAVVTTGVSSAYVVGIVAGPVPLGYSMDLLGPEALPLALAVGFFGLSVHLFFGANRGVRAGQVAQPTMPNLKYLEDAQFDEDGEPGEYQLQDNEEVLDSHAGPFAWEPLPDDAAAAATAKERNIGAPLAEFEEQIKRRRSEIAESVAKRQHARETRRD